MHTHNRLYFSWYIYCPLLCMEFLKQCTKRHIFLNTWVHITRITKIYRFVVTVVWMPSSPIPLPANTATIATSPTSLFIFSLSVCQADALSIRGGEKILMTEKWSSVLIIVQCFCPIREFILYFFYSKKQDIQSILFAASGAIFTPIFIYPPPPHASVLYVYVCMGLLEYHAGHAFLAWHSSWRMVLCMYYITAAGNSSIATEQLLWGQPVQYRRGGWYGPSITYKITLPCWASSLAIGLLGVEPLPLFYGFILCSPYSKKPCKGCSVYSNCSCMVIGVKRFNGTATKRSIT